MKAENMPKQRDVQKKQKDVCETIKMELKLVEAQFLHLNQKESLLVPKLPPPASC
jgi:hypothetical protein